MAKKSFKDNPALQFISAPEREQTEPTTEATPTAPTKAPAGYKINPLYIEKRTQRLQLVLQPSLYERVKNTAQAQGISINEFIHQLLDEATREE